MPLALSPPLSSIINPKPYNPDKLSKTLFNILSKSTTTTTKTMSTSSPQHNPRNPNSQNTPESPCYPTPLSPPLPSISKEKELARALSASSRSSLFALSMTDVLYEDEWLIAVNKPQGVYCEAVLASAAPLVLAKLHGSGGVGEVSGTKASPLELHLANRLDRDTSGVMVITKSNRVASKLVKAFADHRVRKTYIALCIGSAPKWGKVTVRSGHGRSKFGAFRMYAASDVGRALPGGSLVREMETLFEVLSVDNQGKFKEIIELEKDGNILVVEEKSTMVADKKESEILVRAFPRSGRTHQIRLHCQYLGIPIRGDVKYGGVTEWDGRTFDGHELHAESLSFEHPITGLPIMFHAPLPHWATQVLQPA